MSNIFWGIYRNLEREVLSLAEMVHFTDNQTTVYSARIADLLVRCNVEAESLIRELYKDTKKEPLDKVGDMLTSLNKDWNLEKKLVSIISPNMHYSPEYASFCPYNYSNKDSNDFYSAYNAVKHDRASNFEKYATLHFLLRAMGALFLLNIYYRNEEYGSMRIIPDNRLGSNIFAFYIKELNPKFPVKKQILRSDEELGAMYIIRPTIDSYEQYYQEFDGVFKKQKEALETAGYVAEKDESGEEQDISYDDVYKIAVNIGGPDMVKQISGIEQVAIKKHSALSYRVILNKSPLVNYLNYEEESSNE